MSDKALLPLGVSSGANIVPQNCPALAQLFILPPCLDTRFGWYQRAHALARQFSAADGKLEELIAEAVLSCWAGGSPSLNVYQNILE